MESVWLARRRTAPGVAKPSGFSSSMSHATRAGSSCVSTSAARARASSPGPHPWSLIRPDPVVAGILRAVLDGRYRVAYWVALARRVAPLSVIAVTLETFPLALRTAVRQALWYRRVRLPDVPSKAARGLRLPLTGIKHFRWHQLAHRRSA